MKTRGQVFWNKIERGSAKRMRLHPALPMTYARVYIISEQRNLNQKYELCWNELFYISWCPGGNLIDAIKIKKKDSTMQKNIAP